MPPSPCSVGATPKGSSGSGPTVAEDERTDPRDRGYASWLVDTEKVVLSTTPADAPWERTRVVNAPGAGVVSELKSAGDGDILVNSSASVINALLTADLLDRLDLMICSEVAGGGARLLDDGLPPSDVS